MECRGITIMLNIGIKGFARVRRFADGRFTRTQSESTGYAERSLKRAGIRTSRYLNSCLRRRTILRLPVVAAIIRRQSVAYKSTGGILSHCKTVVDKMDQIN